MIYKINPVHPENLVNPVSISVTILALP